MVYNKSYAQQSQKDFNRAKALFDKLAFADAIIAFHEVILKDSTAFEAKGRLADCYRLTGNYEQAEKWYASIVDDSRASESDRFHYGQMLMNNGKYEEAKKWLNIAGEERPSDERIGNYLKSINDLDRFFMDSVSYTLQSFPANGSGNDFCAAFYNDGIVFTASRKTNQQSERHAWTGESFTELYFTDSAFRTSEFASEIRSRLNNGPASFTNNEMFTTINVAKLKNTKKDMYKLHIVSSKFDGRKWSKTIPFPFNSLEYNVAHPAITSDGNRLYFSSDMPGGEGGMDLYYCDREGETWSKPVSLGNHINTPGNELFPFATDNGTVYFSSNGLEGLGGLDIYVTSLQENVWTLPAAISFPVNTPSDDFGFIINTEKTRGYFSSNRPGGKGGDDIYGFIFTPSVLEGIVLNKDMNANLAVATVAIKDNATGKTTEIISDENGIFRTNVSPCRDYEIIATHAEYENASSIQFKSSCTTAGMQAVEVPFHNPLLTVQTVNKFTGEVIDASVVVRESESGNVIATGKSSELKVRVLPCVEYIVIASKEKMPEVKTYFKTPCIVRDEVVKLAMGTPPADPTFIGGIVYDQESKRTLDSTVVVIYDNSNKALASISSASDGTFAITGFKNVGRLVFFRNGYFSVTKIFSSEPDKKKIIAELPRLQLDRIIQLEGIYYDVGKFNIRPDAARVLDDLVEVLKENPSLEIELSAHTDARGKDQSNLDLSDKRAKAAAAYIINKGIAESRIIGRGYGETQLKNSCGNGVKCSEKQHQDNRRTEVKVTGY